jgi:c-di-GMP-binding flagellar brake protein YcgR
MPRFLSTLLERFSDRVDVDDQVRSAFQQAMELNGSIQLLTPDTQEAGGKRTWHATLASVNTTDIIIDTPAHGQDRWQPEQGQTIEVAVQTRHGRQSGRVQCIERTIIETGGSKPMLGWRLAYPPSLTVNERRRAHRVQVGFDLAPQACIIDGRSSGPIEAHIMDLSLGGGQLRCALTSGRLGTGEVVDVEVRLPDPVGVVLVPVRLTTVRAEEHGGYSRVGLSFNDTIEGMADLVSTIETRRARRRRFEPVGH